MGRRHAALKFMPGMFVFPGGRHESGDRRMVSASELAPETIQRLANRVVQRSAGRERSLALTAIRETYEETGILLGRKGSLPGGASAVPGWEAFFEHGVLPELHEIAFVGRAITPTRRPKRFDTRFFTVDRDSICAELPGFVGPDKELVEMAWVDLAAAQALDLPRITSVMLEELGHRLAAGWTPDLPVPFYREIRGEFVRELL